MPRRIAFFDTDQEAGPDFPSEASPTKPNGSSSDERAASSPVDLPPPTNNGKVWRYEPDDIKPLRRFVPPDHRERLAAILREPKIYDAIGGAIGVLIALVVLG